MNKQKSFHTHSRDMIRVYFFNLLDYTITLTEGGLRKWFSAVYRLYTFGSTKSDFDHSYELKSHLCVYNERNITADNIATRRIA